MFEALASLPLYRLAGLASGFPFGRGGAFLRHGCVKTIGAVQVRTRRLRRLLPPALRHRAIRGQGKQARQDAGTREVNQ